jgi:hypothetical protein
VSRQEPGGPVHGAAAFEERSELLALREEADRTAAEAAQTLADLADRLDLARHPGAVARRLAAGAGGRAVRTARAGLRRIGGPPRARRALLAAIPALAVTAAVALALVRQRARSRR